MKTFFVLIAILLFSCSLKKEKKSKVEVTTLQKSKPINIENNKQIEKRDTWEEKQDSLRNVLLESKSNTILKSDFFQEFYIRDLVKQVNDKIEFDLPFDLHSFDCGAPDCYSTNLSFEIPVKTPTEFPKQINCQFLEKGCVEKEKVEQVKFQLVESSPIYVNYYSDSAKSNLILIGDKKNSNIYYFVDVEPNSIKVNLIDKILSKYDEENPNSIIPYRSWKMLTNEYENFSKK